jgi:hypothetical protein
MFVNIFAYFTLSHDIMSAIRFHANSLSLSHRCFVREHCESKIAEVLRYFLANPITREKGTEVRSVFIELLIKSCSVHWAVQLYTWPRMETREMYTCMELIFGTSKDKGELLAS